MRSLRLFIKIYFYLLVLFTISIIGVHFIPSERLLDHVDKSALFIETEGVFRKIFGFELFKLDNKTDCLMLNMAASADSSHPVRAAMENSYYYDDMGSRGHLSLAADTRKLVKEGCDNMLCRVDYGRYWQGHQVVLRPLLLLMDYRSIRILNIIVLTSLMMITLMMMKRKCRPVYWITLAAVFLVLGFYVVPMTIQCSICFYIAFLSMIYLLKHHEVVADKRRLCVVFFIIGGVTQYFDFFTTPQLTLGMPLMVCLHGEKSSRVNGTIILCAVAWLAGYALLWSSKWLMAWLLTGENFLDSAMDSAVTRVSDTVYMGGEQVKISSVFMLAWQKITGIISLPLTLVLCFSLPLLLLFDFVRNRQAFVGYSWLLLIAAIVPVWFVLLKNHSLQHFFFTWRAWWLTVYCLLLFFYFTFNDKKMVYE